MTPRLALPCATLIFAVASLAPAGAVAAAPGAHGARTVPVAPAHGPRHRPGYPSHGHGHRHFGHSHHWWGVYWAAPFLWGGYYLGYPYPWAYWGPRYGWYSDRPAWTEPVEAGAIVPSEAAAAPSTQVDATAPGAPTQRPLYLNYCPSAGAYYPKVSSCPEGWTMRQPEYR